MTKPIAVIVEDDPQLGQIYTLALKADFETELYAEGQTALARLEQLTPTLVVLDLHLPGANGQEILAYIRSNPRLAATHIILATADHQQADFLQDEVEIVLLKPIGPLQLRDLALRLSKPSF